MVAVLWIPIIMDPFWATAQVVCYTLYKYNILK